MVLSTADRIVSAAADLLAREGADRVSLRRVAAAAGVTPMAIYRHFQDRADLLEAVAGQRFSSLAEHWRGRPREGPADIVLLAALADFVDLALREPHVFDYLFVAQRVSARRFPSELAVGESPTFTIVTDLVGRAVAEGTLRAVDPVESGLSLIAVVHGLVALLRGGRLAYSDTEFRGVADRAVRCLLDGLRP